MRAHPDNEIGHQETSLETGFFSKINSKVLDLGSWSQATSLGCVLSKQNDSGPAAEVGNIGVITTKSTTGISGKRRSSPSDKPFTEHGNIRSVAIKRRVLIAPPMVIPSYLSGNLLGLNFPLS